MIGSLENLHNRFNGFGLKVGREAERRRLMEGLRLRVSRVTLEMKG